MKQLLSIFLIFAVTPLLFAQVQTGIQSGIETIEMRNLTSSDMLIGRKIPPSSTKGDFFYESEWQSALIQLKDGREIKNYPIRYDLENDIFEIKVEEEVKILRSKKVSSFEWLNYQTQEREFFINAESFEFDETQILGFFRVYLDGKISLMSMRRAKVKKANYVEGVDMGSRDNKVLKKDVFYLEKQGEVFELTNSKKKDIALLKKITGNDYTQFIKKNKLNLKSKGSLLVLVQHINQ